MLYFEDEENENRGSGIGGDENMFGRLDRIEKAKRSRSGASCTRSDRGLLGARSLPAARAKVVRKLPGPKV